MRMKRHTLVALAMLCTPLATLAQSPWPAKPITLVVGSAPGGSNDTFARAMAKRLQDA
jgi:tripartite-type tricarboxylate transporter receptor subunit TctC